MPYESEIIYHRFHVRLLISLDSLLNLLRFCLDLCRVSETIQNRGNEEFRMNLRIQFIDCILCITRHNKANRNPLHFQQRFRFVKSSENHYFVSTQLNVICLNRFDSLERGLECIAIANTLPKLRSLYTEKRLISLPK